MVSRNTKHDITFQNECQFWEFAAQKGFICFDFYVW